MFYKRKESSKATVKEYSFSFKLLFKERGENFKKKRILFFLPKEKEERAG